MKCEDAPAELPSSADAAEWADSIDAPYPVRGDGEGAECPAWEYPEGVTTVFVLDGGEAVLARYDPTDPAVLDLVRQDVGRLLER